MEDQDIVRFTDAEREQVQYQALAAARACFRSIAAYDTEGGADLLMRDILRAFVAVSQVEQKAHRQRHQQYPGRDTGLLWLEAHDIVATAVAFIDGGHDDPHPLSLSGMAVMSYARVVAALNAREQLHTLFRSREEGLYGDDHADELLMLVEPPAAENL